MPGRRSAPAWVIQLAVMTIWMLVGTTGGGAGGRHTCEASKGPGVPLTKESVADSVNDAVTVTGIVMLSCSESAPGVMTTAGLSADSTTDTVAGSMPGMTAPFWSRT